MQAFDPYNEEVRERFAKPIHAGDVEDRYALHLQATVSGPADGARLGLTAGIEGGVIEAMRFRAWGCPHLIAVADALCAEAEGKPVADYFGWTAAQLGARLEVPRTKAGRLFLVEDALASIVAQFESKTRGSL